MSLDKKIAVFDLDGTLTESKQLISSEMVTLLVQLAERVIVGIISGASFGQFNKQFLPAWPAEDLPGTRNLVLLPTSGSQCYGHDQANGQWQLLDEIPFSAETKTKVMMALSEIIVDPVFGLDISLAQLGNYAEDRRTQITFSALGQNAPIALKRVWDPNQKKRFKIKTKFLVPGKSSAGQAGKNCLLN